MPAPLFGNPFFFLVVSVPLALSLPVVTCLILRSRGGWAAPGWMLWTCWAVFVALLSAFFDAPDWQQRWVRYESHQLTPVTARLTEGLRCRC